MPISDKPEYPPLFTAGFHRLTLTTVRDACVKAFPSSTSRETIMRGLEEVVKRLMEVEVKGDLWLDGSFLTEKINPEDVDLLFRPGQNFLSVATREQKAAVAWFNSNLKASHHCDSYVLYEVPPSDPLFVENEWWYAYWLKQYGWSRGQDMKGIVLVALPDGAL